MQLAQLLIDHKEAIVTGSGWAAHAITMHFPYLRDNGGAIGLVKTLLFGKKAAQPNQDKNEKTTPVTPVPVPSAPVAS